MIPVRCWDPHHHRLGGGSVLYFARVKAGSLKEKKFRQWQYEAVRKRDACLQGTMPLGKFKD